MHGLTVGLTASAVLASGLMLVTPAHAKPDEDETETECEAGDRGTDGICRQDHETDEEQSPEEPSDPEEGDEWTKEKLISPCSTEPPGRNPGDMCPAVTSCPTDDERRYAVWLRDHEYNGTEWEVDSAWYRDDPSTQCRERSEGELDDETVRQAVEEFGLPEAEPQLNPPDGNTIINFETIFYTTTKPTEFTLDVGGTDVNIHARPERFHWDFGEATHDSTHPGQPWEEGADPESSRYITHPYTTTGTHQVNVDVDYTVDWTIGDEPSTIPGTITGQPTPPTEIQAYETLNHLNRSGN